MVRSYGVVCPSFYRDANHLSPLSRYFLRWARLIASALSPLLLLLGTGWSQTDPAGGTLPFSTQVSGLVDTLDLASGNIQIKIPVRSKIGAIPFSYNLASNSHAYVYVLQPPVGQSQTLIRVSSNFTGQPMNLMGAALQYALTSINLDCGGQPNPEYSWSVIDSTFTHHPLAVLTDKNGCLAPPQGAVTTDGSGYTVNFTSNVSGTIYDRAGNTGEIGQMSDPDGNKVVQTASGSTLNYNDTLIPSGTPYAVSATSTALPTATPSVVRQTDRRLFRVRRARFTFSRMSAARAVQMKGFGLSLWRSM